MFIEPDLYKMIMELSIIPTVDLICINTSNQLLLMKRNNKPLKDVYYFPWWRRNKLESLEDALVRKWKEELMIDIDLSRIHYLESYDDIFPDSIFDNVPLHCFTVSYVYFLQDDELAHIHLDSQHSDLKLFDLDDPSLHEMVKIRIRDILAKNIIK